MADSSAAFVAYDVRPAKQIERRGIVELLMSARQAGYDIQGYRYVGFGGTKFVDFQLMERFVGFSTYQSIEHDSVIYGRCVFNKPFNSIKMFTGEFADFLLQDREDVNSVYWLDFDGALTPDTYANLVSVANHLRDGDFLFVTLCAELPAGTRNKSEADRAQVLASRFPGFKTQIKKLPQRSFSEKGFRETAGTLLLEMFDSAFAVRVAEGKFHPLMKVIYSDTSWMVTVGGIFSAKHSRRYGRLKRLAKEKVGLFAPGSKRDFYKIPRINITELERILFDKSKLGHSNSYARRLKMLGFSDDDLIKYHEISRLVPRFVEAAF
ncbi:hypothetical protein NKH84_20935 [Mesorhizobium sp. M0902]|uniref:O-methyltransferase n=1 Tax=Mesorhizobium sp. M0902 TaxID=2957021 RepID=UPI003339C99B